MGRVSLLITGNVLKHFPTIAASAMHENGDGTLKTGKMPIKAGGMTDNLQQILPHADHRGDGPHPVTGNLPKNSLVLPKKDGS